MVDELAGRIDQDRRFAADVSHELRSPLQTLTAASGVLANRRHELDERTAVAVDLVVAEVERFNTLVTDLLELARGNRPVDRQPMRLEPVIRAACDAYGVDPARVHVTDEIIWPLDARRFAQILANLLENAERHGGGVTSVVCTVRDASLHINVDDSGPGVPIEERAMIFYRFGRGRRASARGGGAWNDGTGLGLSLVAQHVADHGGSVQVLDAPGGGARFEVAIPRLTP
jgi:signal transduction histidine kinase